MGEGKEGKGRRGEEEEERRGERKKRGEGEEEEGRGRGGQGRGLSCNRLTTKCETQMREKYNNAIKSLPECDPCTPFALRIPSVDICVVRFSS